MVLVDTSRPYAGRSGKIDPSFPGPSGETTVAQAGDNFYTLAVRVDGNPGPASAIAALNDFSGPDDQPPTGERLLLPQYVPQNKTEADNLPADQAEYLTAGSLRLKAMSVRQPPPPPPPHHSLLGDLVDTFVQVVAVVLGDTLGKMGGPEGVVIAAATAALVDATAQVIEDAVGIKHGFNWREVLDTAVEAAIGDMLLPGAASTPGAVTKAATTAVPHSVGMHVLKAGVDNIAEQGINLLDGGQHAFQPHRFR